MLRRVRAALVCGLMGVLLAGCETLATDPVPTTATVQDPLDAKYYPSDEPLKLGMEHFGRGSYALAERYFRDAVEKAPRDRHGLDRACGELRPAAAIRSRRPGLLPCVQAGRGTQFICSTTTATR